MASQRTMRLASSDIDFSAAPSSEITSTGPDTKSGRRLINFAQRGALLPASEINRLEISSTPRLMRLQLTSSTLSGVKSRQRGVGEGVNESCPLGRMPSISLHAASLSRALRASRVLSLVAKGANVCGPHSRKILRRLFRGRFMYRAGVLSIASSLARTRDTRVSRAGDHARDSRAQRRSHKCEAPPPIPSSITKSALSG